MCAVTIPFVTAVMHPRQERIPDAAGQAKCRAEFIRPGSKDVRMNSHLRRDFGGCVVTTVVGTQQAAPGLVLAVTHPAPPTSRGATPLKGLLKKSRWTRVVIANEFPDMVGEGVWQSQW